jgi:hypothetical protein
VGDKEAIGMDTRIKEGKSEVVDMADIKEALVEGAMMAVVEAVEEVVADAVIHGKTGQVWSKRVLW